MSNTPVFQSLPSAAAVGTNPGIPQWMTGLQEARMYTTEYCSVIKQNEILSFVATRRSWEDSRLREIIRHGNTT